MQLQLDNISHRFGSRRVLEDVRATVSAGQCLVVTGRNGSGKSTLLAIIAGLLRPRRGTARLLIESGELTGHERRLALGMVAVDAALYPELTAIENVRFFAQVRGLSLSESDLRAALGRVGLEERANDLWSEFSSGLRVRLKYAVALLGDPPLLLLDEPTANLDADGVRIVERVVQEQKERGILVLATNEASETRYADQVLALDPPDETTGTPAPGATHS